MAPKPTPIDDYLATVIEPQRGALERLRATIHSLVPNAEEVISYRIPAFRVEGGMVAGFCARGKGCSFFPFSGTTLKTLADDLRAYSQTKSALHFAPEKPLPKTLVRKLVKARMDEILHGRPGKPRQAATTSRVKAPKRTKSSARKPSATRVKASSSGR